MTRFRTAPPQLDAQQHRRREDEWEAAEGWRRGELVPAAITMWLDLRGLYGPEVDAACGVEEPAVDEWEAGERYPTWVQLLALAELVDVPPTAFFRAVPEIRGPIFMCDRTKRKHGLQVIGQGDEQVDCVSPAVWRPVVGA